MNRADALRLAFRRRALVAQVSDRIQAAAGLIAGSTGMDSDTAVKAVFDDNELLAQAHDVSTLLIPEQPMSQIAAQNSARQVRAQADPVPVDAPPQINAVTGMPE